MQKRINAKSKKKRKKQRFLAMEKARNSKLLDCRGQEDLMTKEITTFVISGFSSYYKRSFQPRKYIKISGTEF